MPQDSEIPTTRLDPPRKSEVTRNWGVFDLPAGLLWSIVLNPPPASKVDGWIKDELDAGGWSREFPAQLWLRRGTFCVVDGCGRLAYYAQEGWLMHPVPCRLVTTGEPALSLLSASLSLEG